MHWVTANIGYHHIHHLNARIPFYRLPEAKAAIAELQNLADISDLTLKEAEEVPALKVWDDDARRFPRKLEGLATLPRSSPSAQNTPLKFGSVL